MLRAKAAQFSISLKLTLSLFFLFFIILIIRSNFSLTRQTPSPITVSQTHLSNSTPTTQDHDNHDDHGHDQDQDHPKPSCPSSPVTTCTKAPPSLAHALVHYAATNITPQQTFKEISVSMRVLEKKSPCNFLVFGLGHDSLMWAGLNHGGRTVFLEEDRAWIDQITRRFPGLESYHVTYDTKVHQAEELLTLRDSDACRAVADPRFSECRLALKNLPSEVYDTEWDLIMVDAPTGYFDGAPGRMGAIYTAGLLARNRESGETDVFVHDVDRAVEDKFSKTFLCEGYLTEQEGRLRHFTMPSHRAREGRPFCP